VTLSGDTEQRSDSPSALRRCGAAVGQIRKHEHDNPKCRSDTTVQRGPKVSSDRFGDVLNRSVRQTSHCRWLSKGSMTQD
jgi:hypothetical protein